MHERLAAYAAAGADAVGVQLTDIEDFRRIGATAPAPLVTLWPKAQLTCIRVFPIRMSHRADAVERSSGGHNGGERNAA